MNKDVFLVAWRIPSAQCYWPGDMLRQRPTLLSPRHILWEILAKQPAKAPPTHRAPLCDRVRRPPHAQLPGRLRWGRTPMCTFSTTRYEGPALPRFGHSRPIGTAVIKQIDLDCDLGHGAHQGWTLLPCLASLRPVMAPNGGWHGRPVLHEAQSSLLHEPATRLVAPRPPRLTPWYLKHPLTSAAAGHGAHGCRHPSFPWVLS